GVALDTVTTLVLVGDSNPYYFWQSVFIPTASSGLLELVSTIVGGVDGTVLLDAVTIVQRVAGNIVIQNPSFEASGTPPAPGYVSRISGWTGSGNYGVNFSGPGPFADNGRNPDQDNVAFIQDAGSLSQTI